MIYFKKVRVQMTKSVADLKDKIIKEYERPHLYKVDAFNEMFEKNIDLDNIKIIQGPDEYIERDETISLVSNFLDIISDDYKEEFIKLLNEGKINFDASESYARTNPSEGDYSLYLNEKHTLEDVFLLTHEFFHILSSKNYDKKYDFTKRFYAELPSILSELYLTDYLNENGYNCTKYNEQRIDYLKYNVSFLSDFSKLYHLAKDNKLNYEDVKNTFSNYSEKYINSLLDYVDTGNYDLDNCIRHTFPLLLALKTKEENQSYDKLVLLTNNLWTKEISEYEKIIGFDYSYDNFIDNQFFKDSVDNYLDQTKNYKNSKKHQ